MRPGCRCVSGPRALPRLLRAYPLSRRSLRCYSRSPQTSLLLPHRELLGQPPHGAAVRTMTASGQEGLVVFLLRPNDLGNRPSEPNDPGWSQESTKSSTERTSRFTDVFQKQDARKRLRVEDGCGMSAVSSLESRLVHPSWSCLSWRRADLHVLRWTTFTHTDADGMDTWGYH